MVILDCCFAGRALPTLLAGDPIHGQMEISGAYVLTATADYLLDSTTVVEGPDDLTSPSEPVFVARENARGEDDGYLLSVWWNRTTSLSEMFLHDAADLRRTPLARVKLPAHIPFGFHGNWAGGAALDQAIAAQPRS